MAYVDTGAVSPGDFGKASWANQVRANFIFLTDGTNIETNLVNQDSIAASSVGAGELKFATVTGSVTSKTTHNGVIGTAVGVTTGHWALATCTTSSKAAEVQMGSNQSAGAQGSYISALSDSTYTVNYTIYYHAACPPHRIAGELWGNFVYLLRKKGTMEVVHHQMAVDPLWCRDETMAIFEKDDPRNIALLPHPWIGHDLTGLEVVLVDTRAEVSEDNAEGFSPDYAKQIARKRTGLLLPEEEKHIGEFPDMVEVLQRDAVHRRCIITGESPWDLVKDRMLSAGRELTINGKPFRTGVPAFDDAVTVVTA